MKIKGEKKYPTAKNRQKNEQTRYKEQKMENKPMQQIQDTL